MNREMGQYLPHMYDSLLIVSPPDHQSGGVRRLCQYVSTLIKANIYFWSCIDKNILLIFTYLNNRSTIVYSPSGRNLRQP